MKCVYGFAQFIEWKYPGDGEWYLKGNPEGKPLKALWIYLEEMNPRDLYDFFDSEWIYCDPGCRRVFSDPFFEPTVTYEVRDKWSVFGTGADYETRAEAETAVFEKAFKILNNKLK